MQQGDYSSVSYYQYHPNPNPNLNTNRNPTDHHPQPPSYASAPPFSTNSYAPSDYSTFPSNYPPYPPNPDPVTTVPPTAPSYNPIPNPNWQSFTPSLAQSSSSFPPYDHQPPTQPLSYYPPFDQHQTAPNYAPPNPNPSSEYLSPYNHLGSSIPPVNENSYESNAKFDQGGGYFDDPSSRNGGGYNGSRSDLGSDLYGKGSDSGLTRFKSGSYRDDGVYAYQGNKVEPYGARGTAPNSSTWSGFDDFGRPISFPSGKDRASPAKIVRAVPKADTQQDVKGGVQKFRVKLLAESGGQSTMEVLCQIGLDGIRMLDPSTSRSLRIYPLETVTRFEVYDSSTFAFWSKSSVDIEPRRIRLQSNSYTTNTILDIVTAATVQLKEIGGRSKPSDSVKPTEQPAEKKKGLADWMNVIKPGNEEKDHWVPDEAVSKCTACGTDFNAFVRKASDDNAHNVRVCDRCMAEVTQRLNNANEAASKSAGLQSHEDLAKKLQVISDLKILYLLLLVPFVFCVQFNMDSGMRAGCKHLYYMDSSGTSVGIIDHFMHNSARHFYVISISPHPWGQGVTVPCDGIVRTRYVRITPPRLFDFRSHLQGLRLSDPMPWDLVFEDHISMISKGTPIDFMSVADTIGDLIISLVLAGLEGKRDPCGQRGGNGEKSEDIISSGSETMECGVCQHPFLVSAN
ncbi:RING/FYVE/PHD zinc finger superfamily protein [Actinidia rufa]|uniref:RING/FYVE/PHD zinc finger superfamily protein n=1 Tax=Actinidia rufa TaxID=165716 RepID=A0A7J0GI09_9ERIC|nr:RING/FYVE/PHD zinc finger superfamily protein [Actinidia rufa]